MNSDTAVIDDLVKLTKFEQITGYTPKAVTRKIQEGVWLEDYEVVKAPDGNWLVSMEGYKRWAVGLPRVVLNQQATGSRSGSRGAARSCGQRSPCDPQPAT
jgi:hypothetical protein